MIEAKEAEFLRWADSITKWGKTMTDTCKFCGTVAGHGESNCASLKEAWEHTAQQPFGCPWFDVEARKLHPRPAKEVEPRTAAGSLD